MRRIGRLGDGWYFPGRADTSVIGPMIDKIHAAARGAGRDPANIGIESSFSIVNRSPDEWMQDVAARKDLSATHISVNTMNGGLSSPADHIDAIRRFKETIDSV